MKFKTKFFKNWATEDKDFSKISIKLIEKITSIIGTVFLVIFLFVCFQVYIPVNPSSHETISFTVQKGWGDDEIADSLGEMGLIRSPYFFKFYSIISLKHSKLQAGDYSLSPKMSAHEIANKMAHGDVVKNKLVILEGWNKSDIADYLEEKELCQSDHFLLLVKKDYSGYFPFLKDKPKSLDLEGYLFPDTYEISKTATCEFVIDLMLSNFQRKLTPALIAEITKQNKKIFQVVTMASLIEKEVRTTSDKNIVSGILWKRLSIDMPLQLDATVNYVTGKSDPSVSLKDAQIDSPYNTYKYTGLPKGPISSPGLQSIMAAIYPQKTNYWYYLSAGKTIFSETFEQHKAAKAQYFGS